MIELCFSSRSHDLSTRKSAQAIRGASYSHQICSFGNEDELATSRRSLPIPGLGNLLKRNHLLLDRAAASGGVCEDLGEGLGFLLVGQRIVGIAQDSMQTAAHDS